ncbi:hypothetical protein JBE04_20405 [Streptomyces sp. PRKS01-29]|nr:hypothetical protein [Streptomyces sabulosicollis]MBI0296756.1 hypothetical protein [Streptomyces sabulosicollis]
MELTIPTPHGHVIVEGKPTEADGLVIHPVLLSNDTTDLDWRTVTHAPSGMRFPVNFPNDQCAADFAKSIAHLANWRQAKPDIPKAEVWEIAMQNGGISDTTYYDAYQPERTTAVEVRKAGE